MAQAPPLPTLVGINPDVDAAIAELVAMIGRANNPTAEAPLEVARNATGFHFRIAMPPPAHRHGVIATGGITAAPDANTLGEGNVIIRERNGAALTDGETVLVYSNFSVAFPAGRRCLIGWEDSDWALAGVDCPP